MDLVGFLPEDWLIGGYVSRAGWDLGPLGVVIRPNAMVFLEPSFASQYFALAAIIALSMRNRRSIVFLIAVLVTGSGTGLIALVVGVTLLLVRGLRGRRLTTVIALIGLGAGILFSPVGTSMVSRIQEFTKLGSSASQRFIEPWLHLWIFVSDPQAPRLSGVGSGSASNLAAQLGPGVNYTFIPQAIMEYGIVLGSVICLAVVFKILHADLETPVTWVVVLIAFVLSGAFYQAHTMLFVWLFCCSVTVASPEGEIAGARDRVPRELMPAPN